MTELNSFQSVGSIPVWALPNAPDMTKWQWQPPRPPSFCHQMPQVEDEVEIEIDSSPSFPEPETDTQPSIAPEPPATLVLRETATTGEQIMLRTLAETTQPLGLRLQALLNNTFSYEDFSKRYYAFAKSLRREISDGRLRGPQIFEVYALGRRALERARRQMPQARVLKVFHLVRSVILGIKDAKELNPDFLRTSPHHWVILLKHVARLDANAKSAQLFASLMESMPPRCRFRTRGSILNVLGTFFKLWRGSSIQGNPPEGVEPEAAQALHLAALWAGRADRHLDRVRSEVALKRIKHARAHLEVAEKCLGKASRFASKAAHILSDDTQLVAILAGALKTLDPGVHRSLYVIATKLTDSQGEWARLRYNWLHILARMPSVPQSQFKKLLQLFPRRGYGALTQTEVGELLLVHWESTGMLKERQRLRKIWKRTMAEDETKAMAALAYAINATEHPEQCTAIFWSLWDFMQSRVGMRTVIKQMLSLSETQRLSVGFLKRLAWTSRDYRTALMLHDILVKQAGKDTNAWGPTFWEKYVTQSMRSSKNSLVNPVVLVEKLLSSARPAEAVRQATWVEPQDENKQSYLKLRQITRIRESIKIIAGAPALTERQRFRHTSAFTKYLMHVQGFLTARDLASLTNVITETLKRGAGGSTQRMRWYLGIVFEQLGEEACVQVGLILKRRREWNGRQLAGRVTPEEPAVEQQTASDLHRKHYRGPHHGRTWPLWRYFVPQNRRRVKFRRAREKANTRAQQLHDEQPHGIPSCQL